MLSRTIVRCAKVAKTREPSKMAIERFVGLTKLSEIEDSCQYMMKLGLQPTPNMARKVWDVAFQDARYINRTKKMVFKSLGSRFNIKERISKLKKCPMRLGLTLLSSHPIKRREYFYLSLLFKHHPLKRWDDCDNLFEKMVPNSDDRNVIKMRAAMMKSNFEAMGIYAQKLEHATPVSLSVLIQGCHRQASSDPSDSDQYKQLAQSAYVQSRYSPICLKALSAMCFDFKDMKIPEEPKEKDGARKRKRIRQRRRNRTQESCGEDVKREEVKREEVKKEEVKKEEMKKEEVKKEEVKKE